MSDLVNLSRSEIDKSLRESMLHLLYAVAAIYLGFNAVSYVRTLGFQEAGLSGGHWIALMDGAMLALTVLMIFWLRRKSRTILQVHLVGALLLLMSALTVVVSSLYMESPRELFFLSLMSVYVGAVALYRAFVWAVSLVGIASVLAVAAVIGNTEDLIWAGSTMGAGGLVAAIIFEGRFRQMQRIDELRRLDHENQAALEIAVARAEAELAERKEADAKRESAEAQGESLKEQLRRDLKLKAMGTLAGGVAHDMNNVLAAVRGVAEASLEEGPDGPRLQQDLEHILAAADRGASLTRNLLGFARKGKRRSTSFAGKEVADSVVALLRRSAPKRVDLVVEVQENPPPALGDADQIGHALINLCLNAIEASEGNTIVKIIISGRLLTSDEVPELAAGRYLSIAVSDDGMGMDPETMEQVFEPFFTTKGEGHSGLGLPMVYGTLAEHRGRASIESTPGDGTVVTLLMPASDRNLETKAPPASLLTDNPILIIDDEDLVRRSVARLLSTMGLECVQAKGGQEGLKLLGERKQGFAAILLDLSMPKLSGTESLARIREIDTTTPIIITSGYPKNQDIDALMQGGASAFLAKPFSMAELRRVIGSAMDSDDQER